MWCRICSSLPSLVMLSAKWHTEIHQLSWSHSHLWCGKWNITIPPTDRKKMISDWTAPIGVGLFTGTRFDCLRVCHTQKSVTLSSSWGRGVPHFPLLLLLLVCIIHRQRQSWVSEKILLSESIDCHSNHNVVSCAKTWFPHFWILCTQKS